MAYDPHLADALRAVLADQPDVTEQRMFGGLAFLVGGHLTVAASSQGGMLVRVEPASSGALCAKSAAEPMVMRGRPLDGWLRLSPESVRTIRQLRPWVARSVAYVRTLPPKTPKRAKAKTPTKPGKR